MDTRSVQVSESFGPKCSCRRLSHQEAPLHPELHSPQPLRLLHPKSRGGAGERRHPLQQNLAVLQPAVAGEVTTSHVREAATPSSTLERERRQSQERNSVQD